MNWLSDIHGLIGGAMPAHRIEDLGRLGQQLDLAAHLLRRLADSNPWKHRGAHLTADHFTCGYCNCRAEVRYGQDEMIEEPHDGDCLWANTRDLLLL